MAQSEAIMVPQRLEVLRPMADVQTPAAPLPAPTEEQAQAVDDVFAVKSDERHTIVDAINLAAAAMLLHDVVKDTLAPPADEDEDEQPRVKPKEDEPK